MCMNQTFEYPLQFFITAAALWYTNEGLTEGPFVSNYVVNLIRRTDSIHVLLFVAQQWENLFHSNFCGVSSRFFSEISPFLSAFRFVSSSPRFKIFKWMQGALHPFKIIASCIKNGFCIMNTCKNTWLLCGFEYLCRKNP